MNKPLSRVAERHESLSRRQVLRGLGACITLPTLLSAGPAFARATAKRAPVRMACVYVPNGAIPASWWPAGEGGADFELSPTLAPLANVRKSVQVISGLECTSANGAAAHARAGSTFLTGVPIKETGGSDIQAAISIDQVVASKIGHKTRLASLELSCDVLRKSGVCDAGFACAYLYNLAWRSANQPLTPEHNPQFVFERLFGYGPRNVRVANLRRREAEQHSILDYVRVDAQLLKAKLDGRDRQKLDQYLTSVREIEQRIALAKTLPVANPDADAPAGVPASYSNHVALMFDMLHLVFQTDSTRVATFLLAHESSNRPFDDLGISSGHHDLTHHKHSAEMIEKVKLIDRWYVQRLAAFLEKMHNTEDVDGQSLLHNSVVLYGSGIADGNRHTHENLPVVLAGAGGGAFRPGRYIKGEAQPITNLLLSVADAMGAEGIASHGDSTGRYT